MRALVRIFRKRWFISLLGLLLLALLIWYAGPEFSFANWYPWASENSRVFTIILILGGWGLYRLMQFLRARAVSANVMAAILGRIAEAKDRQTPPSAGQEEVAVLERRIQEAVAVLKKGKESRWAGSQFLYQLPWYILIGPPGSGKTTALTTSNLRFLITDDEGRGQELRGVHGTRDCDWFFTDQAVLLDTAGRYVTQDSREEVDSAAWLGFLKLLKSYRKRRPINGVLVCVSLPDIATQSEVQTQRESQAIRLRIRELHEHLGIRFPIYLLFTKCDLLAGFTEFFDDLGKEERQQVWGMTFPVEAEPSGFTQLFQSELDLLEKRIDDRLVWRLHQERDVQRRALVYGFPHQLASIKSIATRFVNDTFESTRYEMPATLRGVYFTSGIQQGTPLDRLTASLASSFGLSRDALPPFTGHGKSYFVSQLMRDVVFKEAGLANTDLRWERRRVQLQRVVVAGSVGLAVLLVAAWATSYVKNHSYLEEVSQQSVAAKTLVEKVSPSDTRLIATLPPLNAVRTLPGGYESESSVIASVAHLGLDQRENLGGEAKVVYRDLLRTLFLPRLVLHLEERIEDETTSLDDLYASLRIYVMLGDPEHFSADSVEQWLAADLQSDPAAGSRQDRQQLLAHLAALFERGPVDLPIDLDAGVIERARVRLAGISLADRTYAQILESPRVWASIKDFRAVSAAGNAFSYVFVTDQGEASEGRVDRRYTLEGYRVFKEQIRDATASLAQESWIMGEGFQVMAADSELERVRERVSQRYYEDYRAAWASFLDSLTIAPMDNNLNKAIDIVHTLSGDNSPLKNLLVAVERETTLTRGDDLAEKGGRATKEFFDKVGETAENLWQTPALTSLASDSDQTSYPVDRFFKKLNDLVRAKDGGPVPLEETIGLLAELEGFLKGAQGVRGTQLVAQVKELQDSVLGRLEQHAARQPRYLRKWLEVIVWQVSQSLGDRALEFLNDEWRSTVWEDYRRGLKGKYPLARGSDSDAALRDFGNFFGPGGSVDRFFREYLKDLVDTSHQIWRIPPNSPIHLSRESLVMLKRASVIQEAFFTTQDKVPLVKFALKPISMDVSIDDFYLDIDGQTFHYDHSATKVTSATWPGTRETGEVNLRLSPASASGSAGVTIDGPWAWFRLLDRSKLTPLKGADRFEITFDVDGRKVFYELRAESALNPFRLGELERFQCPEIL